MEGEIAVKRVYYNGNKESYYSCQPASDLHAGRCYEVEEEIVFDFQTNYVLKGLPYSNSYAKPGYNSCWFKEVPVYLANARIIPEVGVPMRNFNRLTEKGELEPILRTSNVLEVHPLGGNVYEVYTQNSTYIVRVY